LNNHDKLRTTDFYFRLLNLHKKKTANHPHDTDKVEEGLMVLFFGLGFIVVSPGNFSADAQAYKPPVQKA